MQQGHSSDNPCAQGCNQEKHTQQTGKSASSAHEVTEGHNTNTQTHEDGHTEEDERTNTRQYNDPEDKWRAEG